MQSTPELGLAIARLVFAYKILIFKHGCRRWLHLVINTTRSTRLTGTGVIKPTSHKSQFLHPVKYTGFHSPCKQGNFIFYFFFTSGSLRCNGCGSGVRILVARLCGGDAVRSPHVHNHIPVGTMPNPTTLLYP